MVGIGLSHVTTDAPLIAFVSVLASSLGIPIPTFAALIFVGSLLDGWRGDPTVIFTAFIAGMAGAAIGDFTWFLLGRIYGGRVLSLLCRISISRDTCIRRTAEFFARQGVRILLVAKFMPGLSTVSVPLAGAAGVSTARFYAYAFLGAAIWVATGLAIGFFFAAQIGAILLFLRRIGIDLAAVAVLTTILYIAYRFIRRHMLIRQLRMARIDVQQLLEMIDAGLRPVIVDVRAAFQRKDDPHIIPGGMLWEELSAKGTHCPSLAKTHPVVIYCTCPNETSAALVARRLHKLGFADVRPLRGGLAAWRDAGQPTQKLDLPPDQSLPRVALVPQLS